MANQLISEAIKTLFLTYFPKIEKLKKRDDQTPYDAVLSWFYNASAFELPDEQGSALHEKTLLQIQPLKDLIYKYQPNVASEDLPFLMEFVLWALVEFKQLSKTKTADGLSFNDLYDNLLQGLS